MNRWIASVRLGVAIGARIAYGLFLAVAALVTVGPVLL